MRVNFLMNGLEIIMEYESDPWMSSELDTIYVGAQDGPALSNMSKDDEEIMRINKWKKSNIFKCWMFKLV